MITGKRTLIVPALGLAVALATAGCQGPTSQGSAVGGKPALESPEAVAACLPAGVTLEARTTDKEGDTSETVGDALARLKATPKNHKLYGPSDREIVFYKPTARGLEIVKDKEYNRLRKKSVVVLLAP